MMGSPTVLHTKKEAREWADRKHLDSNAYIVLVPTLGGLHDGHLELVKQARKIKSNAAVIVSIYKNETQFAPHEDFESYPADFQRDLQALTDQALTDAVFAPAKGSMYTAKHQTFVVPEQLQYLLCGQARPHFFKGVATIVTKLLHASKADAAVFGKKDYQQLRIIQRLVHELDFDTHIHAAPLMRASDGLALSSRNSKLSNDGRAKALSVYTALKNARAFVHSRGPSNISPTEVEQHAREQIERNGVYVEYMEAVNGDSLARCSGYPDTSGCSSIADCADDTCTEHSSGIDQVVLATAVKVDDLRLTDNIALLP